MLRCSITVKTSTKVKVPTFSFPIPTSGEFPFHPTDNNNFILYLNSNFSHLCQISMFIWFQFFIDFLQLIVCVLAVVLMDNGVSGQYQQYYRPAYRTRNIQPVSNSLDSGKNNYYNPYKAYNPFNSWGRPAAVARPQPQYKWKLDFDDSIEDMSDSNESIEVYRYQPYRRF